MQIIFCLKSSRKPYCPVGMEIYRKILKSPQVFFAFSLLVVIVYLIFSSSTSTNDTSRFTQITQGKIQLEIESYDEKESILVEKISKNNFQTKDDFYSIWPRFFESSSDNLNFIQNECGADLSIENFKEAFKKWSTNKKPTCQSYFNLFTDIYNVTFKQNHLTMNDKLKVRVREWLGNNEELLKQSYAQVGLITCDFYFKETIYLDTYFMSTKIRFCNFYVNLKIYYFCN